MNFAEIEKGAGTWAILDLPVPLEPVLVDLDRPMEDQLPERYAEAARQFIADSGPAKVHKDNRRGR